MVKPLQLKTLFVLCLLFNAACAPSRSSPTSTDQDKEMAAAVKQGQSTLYVLRRALLAPNPSYVFLSVKVHFTSPDGSSEDLWTVPVDILDNVYTVRMVEGVTLEQGAHPDRLVEVHPEQILDWMIEEKDGTVLGGYTLRVEFKRLTPQQQKRYLEVTGYKFQ